MSDDESPTEWKPASIPEVKEIVQEDLANCDREQLAAYQQYAVEPFAAAIVRYGRTESVIVVARRNDDVIYWEDVECGFNVSPIDENGMILEHSCNQDELGHALNGWIEGQTLAGHFAPTLRELVAQITPENRYGEISASPEVGKEAVEWRPL